MVSFSRFLAIALTFTSLHTILALPTGNATLNDPADVDLTCSADDPPLPGLPSADENLLAPGVNAATPVDREISVYWNVIYSTQTYDGGYLSEDQVNSAITALNSQFRNSGITFKRAKLTYTQNQAWFNRADNKGGKALTTAMKNQLHAGTAKDLNVYSVGFMESNLGGFATFPWWYKDAPKLDGVVFKWNTTPGGTLNNYNQGKILTHEVGHWAGLYHTFQGGCSATGGDYVADTPAEASAATGCPTGRDSCRGPGADPIRNHMDYTYDTCKTDPFTPGQIVRMGLAFAEYRSN